MSEPQATSLVHDAETIDRRVVNHALTSVLAASLRPVCVGLALFYALLTVWYWFELEGEARTTMSLSTALLSIGLVVGAVWFERNRMPPRFAHPAVAVIGIAAIVNALLLLVSVPLAHQTTNLMIVQLGFGCLLFSVWWFSGLALLSWVGWLFVAGNRTTDPEWHHFGLALIQATLFGALVLVVRIRAYRETQELRLRDQVLVRQLKEANQAALVAVKAKSEFLANMSHEIRTPMTAMLGMTELLQMSELSEEQREYASTIERAGNTLLQLVNDILDFSKMEAGHLALESVTFKLDDLLAEVRELLEVKARQKRLELSVSIAPGSPLRFRGDPTRLKQVLVNLVGNAIKFTHEGYVRLNAHARVLDSGSDALLEIAVQDSGIGIPEDKLDQIFDAFTQADASTTRKYGGTGLGLAISRQLTRLMSGELHVDSTPGAGSTFTISLALALVQHRSSIPAPPDPAAASRYEGRVLLVEDNPDNQSLAEELLMRMGCAVEHASNGVEALHRLEQQSYDLVLMDCHMPDMNGYDATREIRRREAGTGAKHVPIVALTASVLPEERARCKEVGMDDYIAKPFSKRDLQEVLERFL
jgi:signal transduction histidine kinase/CheY-like chemotaxis protein